MSALRIPPTRGTRGSLMVRVLVDITLGQGSLATYRTSMGIAATILEAGARDLLEESYRVTPQFVPVDPEAA